MVLSIDNKENITSYHPARGGGCGAAESKIFSLVLFAPTPERLNETGG